MGDSSFRRHGYTPGLLRGEQKCPGGFFEKRESASVSYPLSAMSRIRPGIRLTQVLATTQSAALAGVSTNTQGRHSSSTIAWILLLRPPLARPIACVSVPLFRRWHSDVSYMATVERRLSRQIRFTRDRGKNLCQRLLSLGKREVAVNRLVRPIRTRAILPTTARFN